MDNNITKTVFYKYLDPMDQGVLIKIADQLKINKYVKKLKIMPFIMLFTYAQIKHISSLTDISFELNKDPKLQKEIGLESISKSQLSRKLSDIPPTIFEAILKHLIQKIRQIYGVGKGNQKLRKLHLRIVHSDASKNLVSQVCSTKKRYQASSKMRMW